MKKKMLSSGSLDALTRLKEQNVVVSLDDLENQGYTIIKPQSRWRRWGSALRRYSTTFCVVGTTVGVSVLLYYLFTAKAEIEKVKPFITKAEKFIDKGEQTLDNINEVIKQVCKQFHFPWCSKINK